MGTADYLQQIANAARAHAEEELRGLPL